MNPHVGNVAGDDLAALRARLQRDGYAFQPAQELRERLQADDAFGDWEVFADSWDDLEVDTYLLQTGRFRRRRHAVLRYLQADGFVLCPHEPHFQTTTYNSLQGGIQRWFSPVQPAVLKSTALRAVLDVAAQVFVSDAAEHRVELHQFRIEAFSAEAGQPTPEGMHRDGVDGVLVLLIHRHNIASGTTVIGGLDGSFRSSFTLAEPMDAAWVDDHRVAHAVTPVTPLDAGQPAYRDVLVVTFKRMSQD